MSEPASISRLTTSLLYAIGQLYDHKSKHTRDCFIYQAYIIDECGRCCSVRLVHSA